MDKVTLEKIIKMRNEEGVSLPNIAMHLNDEGIRTDRGGIWHPATVRSMILANTKEGEGPPTKRSRKTVQTASHAEADKPARRVSGEQASPVEVTLVSGSGEARNVSISSLFPLLLIEDRYFMLRRDGPDVLVPSYDEVKPQKIRL
jgi:hypothetical protein